DGWYRTGDLATIDDAGYLRITGRVRDVINRGGEKIPVSEIEQLLYTHPDVADVAIVAMPDRRLGERACAFVVLHDGADFSFQQMQQFLDGQQVAKQYWPEHLEVIAELPRNPAGKVQKFHLREQAATLVPDTQQQAPGREGAPPQQQAPGRQGAPVVTGAPSGDGTPSQDDLPARDGPMRTEADGGTQAAEPQLQPVKENNGDHSGDGAGQRGRTRKPARARGV